MRNRFMGVTVALTVCAMLLGVLGTSAGATTHAGVLIKAVVVHKTLTARGGTMVSLSAMSPSVNKGTALRYRWDLTTDGIIETPFSPSPSTVNYYAPTARGSYTATVFAFAGTALVGRSTVTFSTLRAVVPVKKHHAGVLIKAVVVHKTLTARGGTMVSLSAMSPSVNKGTALRYRWDLTTDGIIETPFSPSPSTVNYYAPTARGSYTATVFAFAGTALVGRSTVTFSTLRAVVPVKKHHAGVLIKAVVVHKTLTARGGTMVSLSAMSPSVNKGTALRYRWDLTTDGIIETPFSPSPSTVNYYAPTARGSYTATVFAFAGTALVGRSTVTFSTLRAVVPVKKHHAGVLIKAVVVHKTLTARGGTMVSLSAMSPSVNKGTALRYRWDLTTDGIIETPFSPSPSTVNYYAPTARGSYTATVFAFAGTALVGRSTVTFSTLRAVV